ncbi:MAG: TIGR02646 family protein [Deltaproteobacteria bacterium]|nr:TIGR02646 family protein [Deltaproteobacteria bacterium]
MKLIHKSEEPKFFSDWKGQVSKAKRYIWKYFQDPDKQNLHQSIMEEQGYLCCYCGQRIDEKKSHIEHVRPRSKFPKQTFEYGNMLASCLSNTAPKAPRHCGVLKDNWYDEELFISPLQPDCEEHFRFLANGEIRPRTENDKAAETTIDKLGLNIPKLKNMRKGAIAGLPSSDLTSDEIKELTVAHSSRDKDGAFTDFCHVLVYHLQHNY